MSIIGARAYCLCVTQSVTVYITDKAAIPAPKPFARVLAIADDLAISPVKVGDVVVVRRHSGVEIEVGHTHKRVVKVDDIACVLEGFVVPPPMIKNGKGRK